MSNRDPFEHDEGFRFFSALVLATPYGLALWIFLWCVFSEHGCLL